MSEKRDNYARQINRKIELAWQKRTESIIETGRHLIAAKADPDMTYGEYHRMIDSGELPFDRQTAEN